MELVTLASTDPLNIPDFLSNIVPSDNVPSDMETWSSGLKNLLIGRCVVDCPVSPTSSHLPDFLMNAAAGTSNPASSSSSPFIQRRACGNNIDNNFGMTITLV